MLAIVRAGALAIALQQPGVGEASALANERPLGAQSEAQSLVDPAARLEPAAEPAPAPALHSLLGGRSIGTDVGVLLGTAGYPFAGLAFAYGITDSDDVGAILDFDWATSEAVVAGTWRRAFLQGEPLSLAFRARAGLYADLGAKFLYGDNRSDWGAGVAPGIAASTELGDGLLSFGFDLPAIWAFGRRSGWILWPRAAVAFELPLYGEITVGARASVGYRGSGGTAPSGSSSAGRVLLGLELLLGCRLL
jgi:hypothetical protein